MLCSGFFTYSKSFVSKAFSATTIILKFFWGVSVEKPKEIKDQSICGNFLLDIVLYSWQKLLSNTILGTCWVLFMAQNIFNFCQVFTLGVKKSLIGQYFLFLYALYLWHRLFVSLIRRPRKSTEIKFYCNKSMFRFKILQFMKVRFVQFSPVRVHYDDSFRATQVIYKI